MCVCLVMDISASDVTRVILQFLRENGLRASFASLAAESQVALNSVQSVQAFSSDIACGRWELVLPVVCHLQLPAEKLVALHELMVLELAEMREVETARALLRHPTGPLASKLREEEPKRYARLEQIVAAPYFDSTEAYAPLTRDKMRKRLADSLSKEVFVVPSSRLNALLGEALKWQQHRGMLPAGYEYDLFRDSAPAHMEESELPPQIMSNTINFGKAAHPEAAAFSPDGQMLITGSADGFIEVWDYFSGKLRTDLQYQAEDAFMVHGECAVLCMCVSIDSEMLVTGGKDGRIKVWKLKTGTCLRKFNTAHTAAVSSVSFSRDGSQILSASFDFTVHIHGLKSGKLLKEFRGHTSYVNDAMYCIESQRVISAGSDGNIIIWDLRTAECTKLFQPPGLEKGGSSIIRVFANPKDLNQMIVCTRRHGIYLMNYQGLAVRTFSFQKNKSDVPVLDGKREMTTESPTLISCTMSPRGDILYSIDSEGKLYAFDTSKGVIMSSLVCHKDSTPYGLTHHPHRNLLATFASDSTLRTWKP